MHPSTAKILHAAARQVLLANEDSGATTSRLADLLFIRLAGLVANDSRAPTRNECVQALSAAGAEIYADRFASTNARQL